jgi:hypothetical protein
MSALAAPQTLILKRAAAILALVAAVVAIAAAVAAATADHQTVVHTHLAKGGTVVVSGYDGGVALPPTSP